MTPAATALSPRPRVRLKAAYLTPEEVLAIAEAGKRAGCHEALFTLGDKPELRYAAAREFLDARGYKTTTEYLIAMCELVHSKTGLLPHVNAGIMSEDEIAALRAVSVSQGIMLESVSERLCERGQAHYGSPDKHPQVRLDTIASAGRLGVPFTSGILIGIGENFGSSALHRSLFYATCTRSTDICRRSSSRTSAPSRQPEWRRRSSLIWMI